MKYLLIAETTCSGDISTCCSDYGIATFLFIIKKLLGIIQFVVPFILIVMAAIGFIQLILDPDDAKKINQKSLFNKFKAAILVFFLPYIVGLCIGIIPDSFEISGCWKAAEDIVNVMDKTTPYDVDTNINKPGQSSNNTNNTTINNNNSENTNVASSTSTEKGEQIVTYARKFIGNPYVWGGNSLTNGVDCSGYAQQVYKHYGISIPRTTYDQIKQGKAISSLDKAKPGDLIFYHNVGHVAIYQGNNKIVHAKGKKYGIVEESANYSTIAGIRRYV